MARIDLSDVGKSNRVYSDEEVYIISSRLQEAQTLLKSPIVTCHWHKNNGKKQEVTPSKAEMPVVSKQEIIDRIADYKIALAPHKKLPEDILRIIFVFCSPPILIDKNTSTPAWLPQVIITQVCSEWRRIALDTMELWNDYRLERIGMFSEYIFTVLFPRARDSPISLIGYFSVAHDRKLIHRLSLYRYRSLFLFLDNKQFSLLRSTFHLKDLSNLGLVHDDRYSAPSVKLDLQPQDFPKLRSLTLRLPISTLDSAITSFPWRQLTVLNLKDEDWGAIPRGVALNILRECVSLQQCKIYVRDDTSNVPRRDVVLPHLQMLYLELFGKEKCFEAFFGWLVLPRLDTLYISGSPFSWSMSAFSRVAERSGFHRLLDLRMHGFSGTVPLCEVLELVPSLDTLQMGMGDITDEVCSRLSQGQLCPRLLMIALHTNEVDVMERLLDVAEYRLDQTSANFQIGHVSGVRPFRRILFKTDYASVVRALGDGRMDKERLGQLKEHGVEIQCGLYDPAHVFHI